MLGTVPAQHRRELSEDCQIVVIGRPGTQAIVAVGGRSAPPHTKGHLLMDLGFLSEFFGAFSDLFSALDFFSGSAG